MYTEDIHHMPSFQDTQQNVDNRYLLSMMSKTYPFPRFAYMDEVMEVSRVIAIDRLAKDYGTDCVKMM